jgi:hypothetical protein
MTNQHPITPPQELVEKWINMFEFHLDAVVLTEVAQWGADQELEACCEWMANVSDFYTGSEIDLRTDRRPKPSTLKEQALLVLHGVPNMDCADYNILLRALEQLDD